MAEFGSYLVGVTAAALIAAMAVRLISKGLVGSVVKLLAGVFMAVAVISPLIHIRLEDFGNLSQDIRMEADAVVASGKISAQQAIAEIITEETAAYILDKAAILGASVSVTVRLSDDTIPVPAGVILKGTVSPYTRKALTTYITEELGIDSEEIEWIS